MLHNICYLSNASRAECEIEAFGGIFLKREARTGEHSGKWLGETYRISPDGERRCFRHDCHGMRDIFVGQE